MKQFEPSFFDADNFVISKTAYCYGEDKGYAEYHICYNVNDGYVHIMGASIISVLENNEKCNFVFHIFTDGISRENLEKLQQLAEQWHCNCIIYVLNMTVFQDFHIKVKRFSRITYGRLCMPKILAGKVKRYVYIYADAMCVRPLKVLFSLDLQGAAMGAVSERESAVSYRAGYLKLKSGKYFNDGVMVVDVDEWEKQHITEKAFSYQNEPPKRFLGQSQDVLNLVFDGKNYFLPPVYNVYDGGKNDDAAAVIVHWTGRRKPWQMVLSRFDRQWRTYNKLSPWETITNTLPIKKPENYHDFKMWGWYQKDLGNMRGYIKGLFWYSWLRIRYKLHM